MLDYYNREKIANEHRKEAAQVAAREWLAIKAEVGRPPTRRGAMWPVTAVLRTLALMRRRSLRAAATRGAPQGTIVSASQSIQR